MQKLTLFIIKVYQLLLSPFLGGACRFYPSCSAYAHGAVTRFGAAGGTSLALLRVLRCHPFNAGGYDPVPETWRGGLLPPWGGPARPKGPSRCRCSS